MKKAIPFFILFVAAFAVFLFWQSSAPVKSAVQIQQSIDLSNYDIRTDSTKFRGQANPDAEAERQKMSVAEADLRRRVPSLKVTQR